ncbi:SPARC-related modular calcium-binding protein 2 isoform X2 [Phymastichus coffea]|uniref:SPARC-related modular calcium-binding protein 2 isoform X2 n=1 Tax=Phymastichus coffea TaxID=108790 RepID=UPI00273BEAA5|nr:SPARC-related modular calcium-binding protein 2 isoform X2 [Phymastichus coffea]
MKMKIVLGLALIAYVAEAASDIEAEREECIRKKADCGADTTTTNSPVCGSDGVTYPNRCSLIAKQCLGMSILIKHTGPCPAPPCFSARMTARPNSRPDCRADGTYSPIQCHAETGYCWCVSPKGRPIQNTSVKGARPRCNRVKNNGAAALKETRAAQRRRSPNTKQKRQYNSRHRSNCDRADKAKFNGNLIENFKIEYKRINASNDSDKNVERVLTWKFVMLDKDGDGFLDRAEYKELRRLAKKAVRPKKCARTFARNCDSNRDFKLSKQEWGACLVVNDFATEEQLPQAHQTRASMDQVSKASPQPVPRPTFNDDPPENNEEVDNNDCMSDRRTVMEDQQKNSQEKFYVPQCTPDGRYNKVQCYFGYCWCVHQDTGKPIAGTSSKDSTPNCNPAPTPVRPMKGCPEAKKQLFLRDLMDFLQKKMNVDEVINKWQVSKEERVATWHFVMLDKNKNKFLEKKEWKSFRTMVANNQQLRKCGKKLPRYCDINNDRRISMTEWLDCLNSQRPTTGVTSTEKTSTIRTRLMGPNPLEQLLNGDD